MVGILGACGASPARPSVENKAAATGTLAEALTAEIGAGRAVAILPGAKGLRALSADGARARVLVAGPVAWAVVDQRSDVVWFAPADRTEIRALDLDAPAHDPPAVITIATGLPGGAEMEMVGPVTYGVNYVNLSETEGAGPAWMEGEQFATSSPNNMSRASLTLGIEPTPELAGGAGYPFDEGETWSAKIKAAALPGKAFVVGLLARKDHRAAAAARPAETHIDGIDPANCEDPADCGRAEAIVGTHYLRVMTANMMGDVRHIQWQLYDTSQKKLRTEDWATGFSDAVVAPDHSAFIAGGVIVDFEHGPIAATPASDAGLGGGWIGGDAMYEF